MAYAQKYPGRLAARFLLKMGATVSKEGEAMYASLGQGGTAGVTPPTATPYYLGVMGPAHASRLRIRDKRELRTLCLMLDMLATQRNAEASDVVAQRIKAIDKSLTDGGRARAQLLELIPQEGAGLLDRDEEVAIARDAKVEQDLRPGWNRDRLESEHRPKGKKGEGKGKVGKSGKGGTG